MSKHHKWDAHFTDANRSAQIDALRNDAPANSWFINLIGIVEDIHREMVQERGRRKLVEQELANLKRERVAA